MVTEAAAIRHYSTVVASERKEISAIVDHGRHEAILRMLDPDLKVLTTASNVGHDSRTGPPTPSLALIRTAFSWLGSEQASSVRQEVVTFLGETLLPLARVPYEEAVAIGELSLRSYKSSTCLRAERYFLESARQWQTGNYDGQPTLRVYYDSDYQAIAFGKSYYAPSALLLRPVAPLPTGTIVNIDDERLAQTGERQYRKWGVVTYQVGSEIALEPGRLSAWAYDDELDRSLFAVFDSGTSYDQSFGELLCASTITTFRDVAAQILSSCGIGNVG